MAFDKRAKSFGEPVSKKEVLKELGHPSKWMKLHLRVEFERHLRPGQTQLDIRGLKSYLVYLEKALENPPGANTGLVSKKENGEILKKAQEKIRAEIEKSKKRLARLEQDPLEIAFYIGDIEWNIEILNMFPLDPEKECLEELKELAKIEMQNRAEKKKLLEEELKKYKVIFHELRIKYYKNRKN